MADGIGGLSQALSGYIYPGIPLRTGYAPGAGGSIGQQQATAQSSQNAYNQSQSQSFIPDYSQTPILERIAQEAEGMAPQVYQWGMQQFNNNQNRIDQLYKAGQEWASPQHIAMMMGQAEAGVQQAGTQALESSKRDLESYGIDPSAGRYAGLDQASRVATAAAAAGAGNQQRMGDIAQGLTLQNQAISSGLQNTQTGYGAANAMNALYGTGMSLKYSPLGTTATATGGSTGQSTSQSTGFSLGMGAGGGTPSSGDGAWQHGYAIQPSAGGVWPVATGGYLSSGGVEQPGYQMGGGVRRQRRKMASIKRGKMPKPQPSKPPPQEEEPPPSPQPPDLKYGVPTTPAPAPTAPDLSTDDQEDSTLGYQGGGRVGPPTAKIYRGVGIPHLPRSGGGGGGGGASAPSMPRGGGGFQPAGFMTDPGGPDVGADLTRQGTATSLGLATPTGMLTPKQMENLSRSSRGGDPGAIPAGAIDPETGQSTYGYAAGGGVVGTTSVGFSPGAPSPAGILPGPPTQAFQRGGNVLRDLSNITAAFPNYLPDATTASDQPVTSRVGWRGLPLSQNIEDRRDERPLYPTFAQNQGAAAAVMGGRDQAVVGGAPTQGDVDPMTWQGSIAGYDPSGYPSPAGVLPGPPTQAFARGGGVRDEPNVWGAYARHSGECDTTGVNPQAGPPCGVAAQSHAQYLRDQGFSEQQIAQSFPEWARPSEDAQRSLPPPIESAPYYGEPSRPLLYARGGSVAPTQAFQYGGGVRRAFGAGPRDPDIAGYQPGDVAGYQPGDIVDGTYARGGAVAPTTGGFVSQALSPSNGRQVDDVPARLNEGEYVIPRDVVHWKGKDFFHKLIAQSRKTRAMHGAPSDDRGYNLGGAI